MSADMPMPGYGSDDTHPTTAHALLRAFIANDLQGVEAIYATNDPRAVMIAVSALGITLGTKAFGSVEALDAYLARSMTASMEIEAEEGC